MFFTTFEENITKHNLLNLTNLAVVIVVTKNHFHCTPTLYSTTLLYCYFTTECQRQFEQKKN